jgi:molybdopterin converting factor small subunit
MSNPRVEERDVPQGVTLKELCAIVGAPADEERCLALSEEGPLSIVLNGRLVRQAPDLQTVMADGDVVSFVVLAAGG